MDFQLEISGTNADMTWEKSESILNNIYLSLTVKRGTFFQNPGFGSRLHELSRAKNTARTRNLAAEYAKEALQWLIDAGRATEITVDIERRDNGLALKVTATQADGLEVEYEHFVEVV